MDVDFILRYVIVPLFSALIWGLWYMIQRQDRKITELEDRTIDAEKDIIEIRTEIRKDIQYLAQDVKEIKDMLIKSSK